MNKQAEKILRLGMAICLAILFLVIVPSHQHGDQKEHDDCIVCMIAHQTFQVSASFALPAVTVFFITTLVLPSISRIWQAPASLQPRAPPRRQDLPNITL